MIHKVLYLLAVIKICTCKCSNESNLTTEETVKGAVKYELYNSNYLNGTSINSTGKQYLKQRFKNVSCIFITHGWDRDARSPSVMDPVNAFLKCEDFNIITVDWKPIAGNPLYYPSSYATKEVGIGVCDLLEKLDCLGICKIEETYAIGHSLGAHLMGILGSCVQKKTGRILRRITGLDPAGPNYSKQVRSEEEMLDQSDAKTVDAIHTDNYFGITRGVGLVDFWPNGGEAYQPGCSYMDIFCSHKRAFQYFTESICNRTSFPSVYCDSYDKFQTGSCNGQTMIHMGFHSEDDIISSRAPQGNYFLDTNSEAPFSK